MESCPADLTCPSSIVDNLITEEDQCGSTRLCSKISIPKTYLSPTCGIHQTSGGREAHGRKNAACRQGCQVAESLVGRGRAMVPLSNHRMTHVSYDCRTSSKMRVVVIHM
jgi:hypothetical protein